VQGSAPQSFIEFQSWPPRVAGTSTWKEAVMRSRFFRGAFVVACLAAFVLGGASLAGAFDDALAGPVSAEDAVSAGAAGIDAAGGGELLSVERTDDAGAVWDVDVLRGGYEVEVLLDGDLRAVHVERELESGSAPGTRWQDADDRPLSPEQARRAGEVAVRLAGGGSIESVERSDDPGEAYEVEVVQSGREIDVVLDEQFRPVRGVGADDD
jgi:hypothetical protein